MPKQLRYDDEGHIDAPARGIELADIGSGNHNFTKETRYVSLAVAGALRVISHDDQTVTIPSGALAAGAMHKLRLKTIVQTGTTATGIVGYW